MTCLNCDSKNLEIKTIHCPLEIKGKTVEVNAPAFVCTTCQTPLMDTDQMNVLRKASADKYREAHNF